MKIFNFDSLKLAIILLVEFVCFPFLFLFEEIKKKISSSKPLLIKRKRLPVVSDKILINIHEWGGYSLKRSKSIKNIPDFECGLFYQLERFNSQKNLNTEINVSISEKDKYAHLEFLKRKCDNIIPVSNSGMDFSGYSVFYNKIKFLPNSYVILTNSSVNKKQTIFLEDYIKFMNSNTDVGILGVSYCSKKMQTLIRNNFTPHLQSFFLLTTTEVLKEIVSKNNNVFPGENITNKLLLILKGEIKLSSLALKLGYNLGVCLEDGSVFKFGKNSKFDNGYKRWSLVDGDMRTSVKDPNKLNEIKI